MKIFNKPYYSFFKLLQFSKGVEWKMVNGKKTRVFRKYTTTTTTEEEEIQEGGLGEKLVSGTKKLNQLFDSMAPGGVQNKFTSNFSSFGNLKQDANGNFVTADGVVLKTNGQGGITGPDGVQFNMMDLRNSIDDFNLGASQLSLNASRGFTSPTPLTLKFPSGKYALMNNVLYLSDGNGYLINLKNFIPKNLTKFDDGLINWFTLDPQDSSFKSTIEGGSFTIPQGIHVKFENNKYLTDGEGNFMTKTGQANFSPEKLKLINLEAHGAYLKQLENKIEDFKEGNTEKIGEHRILPEGIEILHNGYKLVSDGMGMFKDAQTHTIVHIHPVVLKWLNFSNYDDVTKSEFMKSIPQKGSKFQFGGQQIIADGNGNYLDNSG